MSEDAGCAERFLCVLFTTVVKPISDLRLLISGLCAVLFAFSFPAAAAQRATKIPHIGVLVASTPSAALQSIETFQQGLRDLGYIEGQNIAIEYRYAEGKPDRSADFAADLVRLNVDVIVASSGAGVQAAKAATKTIPIVFTGVGDPVADGLVASLARPGGNITGLTNSSLDLGGKRLELLKEAFPKITRVAVLRNPDRPAIELREMQVVAPSMGLQLHILEVRRASDFDSAFAAASRERVQALVLWPNPLFATHRKRILDFATQSRLPVMYPSGGYVEAGGLMSYAPDITAMFRRAAVYVDKILKGAKPADLPVEQPMKFEFVINLKAAKQISVTIPPNVLVRADKVIR